MHIIPLLLLYCKVYSFFWWKKKNNECELVGAVVATREQTNTLRSLSGGISWAGKFKIFRQHIKNTHFDICIFSASTRFKALSLWPLLVLPTRTGALVCAVGIRWQRMCQGQQCVCSVCVCVHCVVCVGVCYGDEVGSGDQQSNSIVAAELQKVI